MTLQTDLNECMFKVIGRDREANTTRRTYVKLSYMSVTMRSLSGMLLEAQSKQSYSDKKLHLCTNHILKLNHDGCFPALQRQQK